MATSVAILSNHTPLLQKSFFIAPPFIFVVVQVQEEGTAKVGISLHFTFGNETDVPLDSKVLG